MAVIVYTGAPRALLTAIKNAIDEKTVRTWSYDTDGDFTHTAQQWKDQAWLRPRTEVDCLVLNVLTPKDETLSTEVYAIYHGRFIEMLLAHFDGNFKSASASAMPIKPDMVTG